MSGIVAFAVTTTSGQPSAVAGIAQETGGAVTPWIRRCPPASLPGEPEPVDTPELSGVQMTCSGYPDLVGAWHRFTRDRLDRGMGLVTYQVWPDAAAWLLDAYTLSPDAGHIPMVVDVAGMLHLGGHDPADLAGYLAHRRITTGREYGPPGHPLRLAHETLAAYRDLLSARTDMINRHGWRTRIRAAVWSTCPHHDPSSGRSWLLRGHRSVRRCVRCGRSLVV